MFFAGVAVGRPVKAAVDGRRPRSPCQAICDVRRSTPQPSYHDAARRSCSDPVLTVMRRSLWSNPGVALFQLWAIRAPDTDWARGAGPARCGATAAPTRMGWAGVGMTGATGWWREVGRHLRAVEGHTGPVPGGTVARHGALRLFGGGGMVAAGHGRFLRATCRGSASSACAHAHRASPASRRRW